ncbi:transcriptional regulator GlxA family with amidase domain [Thermocatellispora tengchongensis]|uniref:Transcriptional regulator GlxA family with amidase domain n=1 Tax=Thermocatellispora tengchongensis TaxID=1073253 RepID=A0A840PM16_9ACTN|nr:helix-turn-helix domain-containing protein [Thermocatellispora tengchongensis]MBB5138831.1 transcriptional regulator GlxA family with amidase domain [Thermocatellispora tengchongensis]
MHRVAVLAMPGVYPFELGVPTRIFHAATDAASGKRLYEVTVCTADGRPVPTNAGYSIAVEHDASAIDDADTVVVTPAQGAYQFPGPGELQPEIAGALARVKPGARLVSICTASYVLAAAGLLDGRPATTHWWHTAHFQRTFPDVKVDPDVLFVDDGDVLTSAGVAAGVDLCLHLVRRDFGSEVANRVARSCVVPPWRDGGQAQYIERPVPGPSMASTAPTRAWALERLGEPLQLADLAAHAQMSRRTFTRRFREEVGMSPGQWLVRQRVELARHLLEETDLPVDRIAAEAGFGTGASLRQHLSAVVGVSPLAYRRTFRKV